MILTRLIKPPLAILAGLLFLSVIVFIITSIPHRIKEPFAVKVKSMDYNFKCTNIDSDEIQIQYFWDTANMGDAAMKFGNTTVFGFNSIPRELLVDETILGQRISNKIKHYYDWASDSSPMVYLKISNNQAEQYLAVTHVRYGVYGSVGSFDNCRYYRWSYIWFDRYRFCERDIEGKLALSQVPIIRQEERAIIINQEFKYYLVTDDLGLTNDPWFDLPANLIGSTNNYWLVENESFGSDM